MNKIFQYAYVALLGMMSIIISSCTDSYSYDAASVSGEQVFFSNVLPSQYEISTTGNSFTVPVSRYSKGGALNVPLTVTMSDGSIFSVPASVNFADGQETADLVVSYDASKIVYGKYDTITVAINDPAITTPYGISVYKFTAGITEWIKMNSKGKLRDDMIGSLYSVGNEIWDVDIYRSAITPGRYLVHTPYGPESGFVKSSLWENDEEILKYWVNTGNCDMVIDATDPDFVYFEYFDSGLNNLADEGMLGMTSYVWYWLRNGNDLETIKAARPSYFGKLKDNVITFETPKTLLMTMNGENELKWYGNSHGMMAIALPGGVFSDYSASVTYEGIFTNPAGEVFAMGSLTLGPDATNVKGIVMPANVDANAVADAIAAGELEAADVAAGSFQLPISEEMSGKLQIIIAVIDGEDVKTVATAPFEYFGAGGSGWKSLGVGFYTEDYIVSYYGTKDEEGNFIPYDPETYQVEIEANTKTPGLYRMKNAYAPLAAMFGLEGGDKDIEVNAEDPAGVYIMQQPTGFDAGSGEMSIESLGGYLIALNSEASPADVIAYYTGLFGTLNAGEITFPSTKSNNGVEYQGYLYRGGELLYYGGTTLASKIVLPNASAAAVAKAKRAASATDFARRLSGKFYQNGSVKVQKKLAKKLPLKIEKKLK